MKNIDAATPAAIITQYQLMQQARKESRQSPSSLPQDSIEIANHNNIGQPLLNVTNQTGNMNNNSIKTAIDTSNLSLLKTLLEQDGSIVNKLVDTTDPQNPTMTPLAYAIKFKQQDSKLPLIVNELLANKADVKNTMIHIQLSDTIAPIPISYYAIENNLPQEVSVAIVNKGGYIEELCEFSPGESLPLLAIAIKKQQQEVVDAILARCDDDILFNNRVVSQGQQMSLLDYAIKQKNPVIIDKMLSHPGDAALTFNAEKNSKSIIGTGWWTRGLDLVELAIKTGDPAVLHAVKSHPKVKEFFIEKIKTDTLLPFAMQNSSDEVTAQLIESGASIKGSTYNTNTSLDGVTVTIKMTPLCYAIENNQYRTIEALTNRADLLPKGANVDSQEERSFNHPSKIACIDTPPLIRAIEKQNFAVVDALCRTDERNYTINKFSSRLFFNCKKNIDKYDADGKFVSEAETLTVRDAAIKANNVRIFDRLRIEAKKEANAKSQGVVGFNDATSSITKAIEYGSDQIFTHLLNSMDQKPWSRELLQTTIKFGSVKIFDHIVETYKIDLNTYQLQNGISLLEQVATNGKKEMMQNLLDKQVAVPLKVCAKALDFAIKNDMKEFVTQLSTRQDFTIPSEMQPKLLTCAIKNNIEDVVEKLLTTSPDTAITKESSIPALEYTMIHNQPERLLSILQRDEIELPVNADKILQFGVQQKVDEIRHEIVTTLLQRKDSRITNAAAKDLHKITTTDMAAGQIVAATLVRHTEVALGLANQYKQVGDITSFMEFAEEYEIADKIMLKAATEQKLDVVLELAALPSEDTQNPFSINTEVSGVTIATHFHNQKESLARLVENGYMPRRDELLIVEQHDIGAIARAAHGASNEGLEKKLAKFFIKKVIDKLPENERNNERFTQMAYGTLSYLYALNHEINARQDFENIPDDLRSRIIQDTTGKNITESEFFDAQQQHKFIVQQDQQGRAVYVQGLSSDEQKLPAQEQQALLASPDRRRFIITKEGMNAEERFDIFRDLYKKGDSGPLSEAQKKEILFKFDTDENIAREIISKVLGFMTDISEENREDVNSRYQYDENDENASLMRFEAVGLIDNFSASTQGTGN